MADDGEARADATDGTTGLGGRRTTPAPPDPNGGDITPATSPEAVAYDHRGLHEYAARYSGRTLLARLILIARRCEVEATEFEALRMAAEESRKGKDAMIYGEVHDMIYGRFDLPYDQAWVDAMLERHSQSSALINADLNESKENQLSTSIMAGYVSLGDLHYEHGDLPDAFKSYIQMEDFCSAPEHVVDMSMKCILVNIDLKRYDRVLTYVTKANSCLVQLDPITIAKLQAAAGLAYIGQGEYKLAALQFLGIGPELERNYSEVLSPEDVAVYGALCGLASFNSTEVKVNIMENIKFASFLQLEPRVWQLVDDFFHYRHKSFMYHLDSMKPRFLLDIHIADHMHTIYLVISQKSGYNAMEVPLRTSNAAPNAPSENASPLNGEGEEEPADEENEAQTVIVSNFVLPNEFNDETRLVASSHYKFVILKDLLLSLGKRNASWVSRQNAHAVLINASLFLCDSILDDVERFDGRMVVVSDAKFIILEVQYNSYTSTRKPLKETRIQDKEDSAIDRFQIKGDIWTRRRICLKDDHSYHLLQWRKSSGLRRAQVQPPAAAATTAQNENSYQLNETIKSLIEQLKDHSNVMAQVQPPAAAAATQNENSYQLNETIKTLIEQLKDHSNVMAETRQAMVQLNSSLAESRKTATSTGMGAGGAAN